MGCHMTENDGVTSCNMTFLKTDPPRFSAPSFFAVFLGEFTFQATHRFTCWNIFYGHAGSPQVFVIAASFYVAIDRRVAHV